MARIFDGFEMPHEITIYQPRNSNLIVDLVRLAVSFRVNKRGLLECRQLQAEIDPDQDAGTWYGLKSKIVLRSIVTPTSEIQRQRSILVPIGDLRYRRNGPHVEVLVANNGDYGRFTINEVLGRLDCPAEPRLLYLKAQLHAYTSYFLPDRLTGRTGTEESLHCLTSGYCQPWMPLAISSNVSLASLAKLTPRREYYPPDLKKMQQVFWNPDLTFTIQHDGFRTIVERVRAKSVQLATFSTEQVKLPLLVPNGETHLTFRGHLRRETYQRPNAYVHGQPSTSDFLYTTRDRPGSTLSKGRVNAMECVNIIRAWPSKLATTRDLAIILQTWSDFGDHSGIFDKVVLADLLDVNFKSEWGSLVNYCCRAGPEESFHLMFLFGLMSFSSAADMEILRALIAFCVLDDLKKVVPPVWPSYTLFRQNHVPRVDDLMKLVSCCFVPYPPDERSLFDIPIAYRQAKKLEAAERDYKKRQEVESKSVCTIQVLFSHLLQSSNLPLQNFLY